MKKWICLILSLTALLCACGAQEAEESTIPPTRETVQYGYAPTEGAPTEAPTQPEVLVEVKDVFADKAVMLDYDETYYYHIPSIHISNVDTADVNKQMYDELYGFIDLYVYQNPDYPYLGDMGYLWAFRKGIVSVVTEVIVGPDSSPNPLYVIYNVDTATGQRISNEELIASFGLSMDAYREQVAAALEKTYVDMYQSFHEANPGDALYQQQYDRTVSDENVDSVIPYIDISGELCVVADIYSLAGGDSYRNLVCLSGAVEPSCPEAEPFE